VRQVAVPWGRSAYQQVLDMGGAAFDRLELVLGCSIDETFMHEPLGARRFGTEWAPALWRGGAQRREEHSQGGENR